MRLIILAAGEGSRLRPLTLDRPKCLVKLQGRPLLEWQLEAARAAGIHDIAVVGGYRIDALKGYDVTLVENPAFASTNMVRTLFCARELFGDGFVMSYGDIVYSPSVLHSVLDSQARIAVAVDRLWRSYWERRFSDPLGDAETLVLGDDGAILEIGQKPKLIDDIDAQYIGLVAFRCGGVSALDAAYRAAELEDRAGRLPFCGARSLDKLYMTDLLQGLISRGERLEAVGIDGQWLEVDSESDLQIAEELVERGRLSVRLDG
jgi:choline kinase